MKTILSAFLLFSSSLAHAFFLDSTSELGAKSTVHYDIIKNVALCLGYSAEDAAKVATYSQAADIPTGFNGVTLDFIDHDGPNAAYLHAPQLYLKESPPIDALSELKKWALGQVKSPAGMPQVTDQVIALSGTLGAYGVYLHALGDRYSHGACISAGYIPHCTNRPDDESGEGHMFHKCQNLNEERLCHYSLSHTNEFGKTEPLTRNTFLGLQATYSDMAAFKGLPSAVPQSLLTLFNTFANTMDASQRTSQAGTIPSDLSCKKAP